MKRSESLIPTIRSTVILLFALASTGLAALENGEAPQHFLRVELLDAGVMALPLAEQFRVLRFDYEFNRWRVGVSALDIGNSMDRDFGQGLFGGFLAADIGYRLNGQPKRTATFHGMVPSVWAEAAALVPPRWLRTGYAARVDCRAEVDCYGAGLGAEAGVTAGTSDLWPIFVWPYVRVGVILGVASFRL